MTRSEEIALKKYPVDICGYTVECRVGAKPQPQDWNEIRRTHFQEGYEQAEKDLAPIIEAAIIVYEEWHGGPMANFIEAMDRLGELVEPLREERFKEAKK